MKDIKTEREQLRQIVDSLIRFDVLSAAQHMRAMAVSELHDEVLDGHILQLEEDYRTLLFQSSTESLSFEDRQQRMNNLKQKGLVLHSRLSRALLLTHENTIYASTFQQCSSRDWKTLWRETIDMDEHSQLQDDIFDAIWTSQQWTEADRLWWQDFMEHQNELVLQHWLGAVILSVWMFWDVEKMYLLTYFTRSTHENVRAHAILGNIVVLCVYPDYYSYAFHAPNPFDNIIEFKDDILQFQLEFIRMKACERIEAAESEELDAKVPNDSEEQNVKRMIAVTQRYNRLRMRYGLDHSFSKRYVLHICKFLKRTAHWWAPFDESRSEVAKACYDENGDVRQAYQLMIEASHECDLQHYLSCFMLSGDNVRMEIRGEMPEDLLERLDRSPLALHKRLVHNLYRINYQCPVHQFLKDIFNSVSFLDNHFLGSVIQREGILEIQTLACELELPELMNPMALEDVASTDGLSAELAKLISQCYMYQNNYAKALSYLDQADLLCEADEAMLFNMASCAHHLGKYDREAEVLKRWHELDPEHVLPIQNLSKLYFRQKRYFEAKPVLLEFTFRHPQNLWAWMQLIITELQLEEFTDTQKSVARMFQSFPTHPMTFFMAGCLALMKEEWNEAIAHFRRVGEKEFAENFKLFDDLSIPASDKELIYDCVMRQ